MSKTIVLTLSRSVRRQLYTADLVYSMANCLILDIPKKTKKVLARIKARVNNINNLLYGSKRFVLKERDLKKHEKTCTRLQNFIAGISEDEKLTADFLNAVLMLIDDTCASVRRSKDDQLKKEWDYLNRSFATFVNHIADEPDGYPGLNFPGDHREYNHRDGSWIGYKYQYMGDHLAQKLLKIMGC